MNPATTSGVLLEEERHVRGAENAFVTATFFLLFWGVFALSWWLSSRYVPAFKGFDAPLKADWCSRINSTIHAVAVIIGVGIALTQIQWGHDYLPFSSIRIASHVFSLAIGYFMCDLMIILIWPVPMQYVFIIHHIVAVIPYFINNFIACCAACQFGLLMFLLVELATLPLNVRGFIESVGKEQSRGHSRSIYATYIIWAISRTLLPIYLIYVFWSSAYTSDRNQDICLYPSMVCAHIIALFCVGVFFFVHTPEIMQKWKDTDGKAELKNVGVDDSRTNEGRHAAPSRQEDIELGGTGSCNLQSPRYSAHWV